MRRLPYFLWWLGTTIVGLVVIFAIVIAGQGEAAAVIIVVVEIVMAVIQIYIGVLRLHDIGRSGWWLLITLVPLVNLIFVIYLFFAPSEQAV